MSHPLARDIREPHVRSHHGLLTFTDAAVIHTREGAAEARRKGHATRRQAQRRIDPLLRAFRDGGSGF